MRTGSIFAAVLGLAAVPGTSAAQHTGDNAVAAAEDAFGTSVGKETIGVYDEENVRGFSPVSAGNFRMEGLYFDIQGSLGSRVIAGETIHVGPSTQGYAFPAPTGIIDLALRKPDGSTGASPLLAVDSFGTIGLEIDAQMPLDGERLAVAFGAGLARERYSAGNDLQHFSLGVVPRWRPAPGVELTGFYSRQQQHGEAAQPLYIPDGAFLPAPVRRAHYPGPGFARTDFTSEAFGLLGEAKWGAWTLHGGLFRSREGIGRDFANIVILTSGGGSERQVFVQPPGGTGSWSGEVRLSRRFTEGPRQHVLTATLRGKAISARYSGGAEAALGPAPIDGPVTAPEPDFTFGPQTGDSTRQLSGGLAWTVKWSHHGEITLGALRTHYTKRVAAPGLAEAAATSDVTLPYAAATLRLGGGIALFGSWVRGLEDAGSAPAFASNANQVLPAIRTRQVDFGLRWSPRKGTTVILGGFAIAKPYIDIDNTGFHGVLGEERHKGIEVSVTSALTPNLRLVAGGVYQRARVAASPVIAQPIGLEPVNQPAARTRINLDWTLPFAPAWTLDAYLNHDSGVAATVDNRVRAPGGARFGAGVRYRFSLAGKPFTARVMLYNVADTFFWVPVGSGVYAFNNPRNVTAYLTADF